MAIDMMKLMKMINRLSALVKLRCRVTYHQFYQAERLINFTKRSDSSKRTGFTLLEMIVSIGLFAVVITISVGAMLAIGKAQAKATNIQIIQDNLRFSLEAMTKEMRTGTDFVPANGSAPSYQAIQFTHARPQGGTDTLSYCFANSAIVRRDNVVAQCANQGLAVTDSSVIIDQLTFYVIGASSGPSDGQPRITISLRAHSADPALATSFTLQTTITPRERDF